MSDGMSLGSLIGFLQSLPADAEVARLTRWFGEEEAEWIGAEGSVARESGRKVVIEISLPDRMVSYGDAGRIVSSWEVPVA